MGDAVVASDANVWDEARSRARVKAALVPRPTDHQVLLGLRAGERARAKEARQGGERRGGNVQRRQRRLLMWREWGGPVNGYLPCVYCGCRLAQDARDPVLPGFDEDKLIGGPEGGGYDLANLVPACPNCNRGRGRRPHPFGAPEWGDPVENALRVAVENRVAYKPRHAADTRVFCPEPVHVHTWKTAEGEFGEIDCCECGDTR